MDELFDRHSTLGGPELKDEVERLLAAVGSASSENAGQQKALLWSAIRLIQDDAERWDMKIACRTLSELGEAFDRLRRFKRRRKVTVFGSARTPAEASEYQLASGLGALLAANEYMVITGAGGGVMQAAHEGAGRDHSLGFNIVLPFEQQPNPVMRQNANYIVPGRKLTISLVNCAETVCSSFLHRVIYRSGSEIGDNISVMRIITDFDTHSSLALFSQRSIGGYAAFFR